MKLRPEFTWLIQDLQQVLDYVVYISVPEILTQRDPQSHSADN